MATQTFCRIARFFDHYTKKYSNPIHKATYAKIRTFRPLFLADGATSIIVYVRNFCPYLVELLFILAFLKLRLGYFMMWQMVRLHGRRPF